MLNENELNAIKGLMHYLNGQQEHSDLAFDIKVVDSNGDVLARVEISGGQYQFMAGDMP